MTTIIGHRAHIIIRWAALFVALIVMSASLLQVANVKRVAADTGGYPWPDAPCATSGSNLGKTSGTGYWCSGYNWGESTCPAGDGYCTTGNKMNGYYLYDQWGESFRNCVSYTAYKLSTVFSVNPSNWGNGTDWNNSAIAAGYSDDSSPQVGDIAQWDATQQNQYGHVAYVYAVDPTTHIASYDEYNYAADGNFLSSYTSASNSQGAPTHYIHIGTLIPPSSNHLKQFYISNGSWTAADISAATGVSVAGNPATSSGGELARGTNGHLYQFYVANGSWTAFDISNGAGGVNIAGNPMIDPGGGIWARDTNGDLRQFYVANGSWTSFDVSAAAGGYPMYGDPGFGDDADWIKDTNGHLREFYVSNGSWTTYNVSAVVGNINIYGNPVGSDTSVWAHDTSGHLRQFYMGSGGWTTADISGATGVNISGDPAISSSGPWAQDTSSHLRQFYISNGSWVAADISGATGVNVSGNPVLSSSGPWARDTNNHLRQFYISNGSWTTADISGATGGTGIAGDPAMASSGPWAVSQ